MRKNRSRLVVLFALLTVFAAMAAFGAEKSGVVVEDGQTHVYTKAGKLVRNKPVYEVKTAGKQQYFAIDKKGAAKQLKGVEELAAKRLIALKAGGKKSEKNLKKAFAWSTSLKYVNNTNNKKGNAAAKFYGQYGFENGRGDCNTVAYTFYWMAKLLGYAPKTVQGYVPDGSITNLRTHAWVTIKFGNKTFIFDPDFERTYKARFGSFCGYKKVYGQKNTYKYFSPARKEIR